MINKILISFVDNKVIITKMSTYHPHGFTISDVQKKKLKNGDQITIKATNMNGSNIIYLTATQKSKANKAVKEGKGMRLLLSGKQLAYNIKNGSGFWDSIWSGIKDVGNYVGNKVVLPIGEKIVLPTVIKVGEQLAQKGMNRLTGGQVVKRRKVKRGKGFMDFINSVGNVLGSVVEKAIPIASNVGSALIAKRLGMGVKKRRAGHGLTVPGSGLKYPGEN